MSAGRAEVVHIYVGGGLHLPPLRIRLSLHPTAEHLQAAARRTVPDLSWEGVDGCFHPKPMRASFEGDAWRDTSSSYAGQLRLHRGNLRPEVIVHEALHAAAHVWRIRLWALSPEGDVTVDLGDDCGEEEEAFAYLLGSITDQVVTYITKWTEET